MEADPLALTVPSDVTPAGGAAARTVGAARFTEGSWVAGRYRIVRLIGQGGMGDVYEARDLELEEPVALKTVRSILPVDAEVIGRFKREIQLARRVTHPNVCRLFDFGVHQLDDGTGVPFFSMELLPGETLADFLGRKGALDPEEALPLVVQMAAALEAAHAADVVHADFKPANVMLVGEGPQSRVVVTDFGLARAPVSLHPAEEAGEGIAGSPAYLAPEQVQREPVTPAADVYSLGVTMFEMVTGELPFRAETAVATARRRLELPPPSPRELRPQLPERWDRTIRRCLARSPAERFPSARLVGEALGDPGARGRRWGLVTVGAAFVLLLAIVTTLAAREPAAVAPVTLTDSLTLPVKAAPLHEGAREALRVFDAERAQRLVEEALELEPDHPLLLITYADALNLQGRYRQAQEAARKAMSLAERLPQGEALLVEGRGNFHLNHKSSRSVEVFSRLLERYPNDFEIWLYLADSHAHNKDQERTLATLAVLRQRLGGEHDARLHLIEATAAMLTHDYQATFEATRAAIEVGESRGQPHVVARASRYQSDALRSLGRLEEAARAADRAARLYAELGSRAGQAIALGTVFEVLVARGSLEEALRRAEERRELLRTTENTRERVRAELSVVQAMHRGGALQDALHLLDNEVLPLTGKGKDTYSEAIARLYRCQLRHSAGDLGGARTDCELGIAVARSLSNRRIVAWGLDLLGAIAVETDDHESARAALEQAREIRVDLNLPVQVAQVDADLAMLHVVEARWTEALERIDRALEQFRDSRALDAEGASHALRARCLAELGRLAEAGEALGEAMEHAERSENPAVARLAALAAGYVAMASGDSAALRSARERLEDVFADASEAGYVTVALSARLVLGLIERAGGDRRRARAMLRDLGRDARRSGHLAIARQAAEGLD